MTRFERWRERLGLARNVLALRLKTLTQHGLLERTIYCDKPARYEYLLTDKGRDIYPVIITLRAWGDRYIYGQGLEPQTYLHADCGHAVTANLTCPHCEAGVDSTNVVRARRTEQEAALGIAPYAPVVAPMKPPPRTRAASAGS